MNESTCEKATDRVMNCSGCKYLDRYKADGNGYCCHVEGGEQWKAYESLKAAHQKEFLGVPSLKVRTANMERCELYEAGDFKTRHKDELNAIGVKWKERTKEEQ